MRSPQPSPGMLPDLGPRGEGWVGIQTSLIVLVLAAAPLTGGQWSGALRVGSAAAGALLVVIGIALFALGARALGRAFSIWMAPTGDRVVDDGPYRLVRHPICGGQVLIGLGVSLVAASWLALALAAVYAALVAVKGHHEEAMIERRLPAYEAYRRRVRHVWLPGLL